LPSNKRKRKSAVIKVVYRVLLSKKKWRSHNFIGEKGKNQIQKRKSWVHNGPTIFGTKKKVIFVIFAASSTCGS
jgi:hypothetical protein